MFERHVRDGQTIVVESGDITTYGGCIVNAANNTLLGGGGVDGAIHRAAGPGLLVECRGLGGCATGEAKATSGYRLAATHVIHTVGPIYYADEHPEVLLASCYRNSLDLAFELDEHEVTFPAISCGVYGYPIGEAAPIAVSTVTSWLDAHPDYPLLVRFCCFSRFGGTSSDEPYYLVALGA